MSLSLDFGTSIYRWNDDMSATQKAQKKERDKCGQMLTTDESLWRSYGY